MTTTLIVAALLTQAPAALRVPGFTAYGHPDAEALNIGRDGLREWGDSALEIHFFGHLATPGLLRLGLTGALPPGEASRLRVTVAPVGGEPLATFDGDFAGRPEPRSVDLGEVEIPRAGYYRFAVRGLTKSGANYALPQSLDLAGPAIAGARFNVEPRRNAASVHLTYPVPEGAEVAWFYSEVTARTEPIHTYYEVCGWHRGYFGIQVNSPTERRIIFSVWDAGDEAIDRNRVADENRVTLLAKGDGVYAGGFGNEGTGGHSHLVYSWTGDTTYRLLLTAELDGDATIYTGWFFFPERGEWGLIARFRAPKDGRYPRGLYAFVENFGGSTGHLPRRCEFGYQWARLADGRWLELTEARFSHDPTGREMRRDYAASVVPGGFFLANGGFEGIEIRAGDRFTRPPSGGAPPEVVLPEVPNQPAK